MGSQGGAQPGEGTGPVGGGAAEVRGKKHLFWVFWISQNDVWRDGKIPAVLLAQPGEASIMTALCGAISANSIVCDMVADNVK